jgi:nucleoid DNA-binding protein
MPVTYADIRVRTWDFEVTMNRTEMVSAIARRQKIRNDVVEDVVEAFLDLLVLNMAVGEDVTIRGLGRFETRLRPRVKLQNPHNGQAIDVPPRRTMVFKPSMKVKERLNNAPL